MTRRPLVAAALALALASCAWPPTAEREAPGEAPRTAPDPASPTSTSSAPGGPVAALLPPTGTARLVPEVVASVPHDPAAFTQGLEAHDGVLLESTGLYGLSDRRRVDPATGEVLDRAALPPDHFAEGLTVVDGRMVQLTWREGVAHLVDPRTLEATDQLSYTGEGWGVCWDGAQLFTSDGSATLTSRDPQTFAPTGQVTVTLDGGPLASLNELECADGLVWANVWLTTDIVAIDPGTGAVRAVVDASALVPEGLGTDAVLNGIARRPGHDTFWLTGKLWPVLYEVRLVLAG